MEEGRRKGKKEERSRWIRAVKVKKKTQRERERERERERRKGKPLEETSFVTFKVERDGKVQALPAAEAKAILKRIHVSGTPNNSLQYHTHTQTDKRGTLCCKKQARAKEGGEAGTAFFGVALVRAGLVQGQKRWDAPCVALHLLLLMQVATEENGQPPSASQSLSSSLHGPSQSHPPIAEARVKARDKRKKIDMAKGKDPRQQDARSVTRSERQC